MKIKGYLKKHPVLIIVFFLLIVLSVYLFFRHREKSVMTTEVKKGSIMECVYGVGMVNSNKTFQIKSGIPSKIRSIYVNEGDYVEKGAKLMELETLFVAPFNGVVTSISGASLETAFPQTVLMNLMDLEDRYVLVTLDQVGALSVKKGQKVKLSFDGIRERTFVGEVSAIYPKDNKFFVHMDCKDLPKEILPGMTADVAIEIAEHTNVLLAPVAAINKNQVLVLKKNQKIPSFVSVKVGLVDQAMAEISSKEIQEGDYLLLEAKVNK